MFTTDPIEREIDWFKTEVDRIIKIKFEEIDSFLGIKSENNQITREKQIYYWWTFPF